MIPTLDQVKEKHQEVIAVIADFEKNIPKIVPELQGLARQNVLFSRKSADRWLKSCIPEDMPDLSFKNIVGKNAVIDGMITELQTDIQKMEDDFMSEQLVKSFNGLQLEIEKIKRSKIICKI